MAHTTRTDHAPGRLLASIQRLSKRSPKLALAVLTLCIAAAAISAYEGRGVKETLNTVATLAASVMPPTPTPSAASTPTPTPTPARDGG